MAVPKYDEFMKPILIYLSDKKEHKNKEILESLADYFNLSDDDKSEIVKSSGQPLYKNRISWATTYLKKANLIISTSRGILQITDEGLNAIKQAPEIIDIHFLSQYPSFRIFFSTSASLKENKVTLSDPETPETQFEQAYDIIMSKLADELYEKVMLLTPDKFKYLVIDLIRSVGYGYPEPQNFRHTGKSGDGGVDGIIKEDKFGFNLIYIQAKHWNENHNVGSREIRDFYGSMASKDKSRCGIFVTTSAFTNDAIETSKQYIDRKMILIDKEKLLKLMIEHNIGVVPLQSYVIKKVDENVFEDDNE